VRILRFPGTRSVLFPDSNSSAKRLFDGPINYGLHIQIFLNGLLCNPSRELPPKFFCGHETTSLKGFKGSGGNRCLKIIGFEEREKWITDGESQQAALT
jgi:hypothetical protein